MGNLEVYNFQELTKDIDGKTLFTVAVFEMFKCIKFLLKIFSAHF